MAEELARLAKEHSVDELVMGFPGTWTARGAPGGALPGLCRPLEEVCGLKPVLWDERRTTVEAHGILHASGNADEAAQGNCGCSNAAALILEGYLTRKKEETT